MKLDEAKKGSRVRIVKILGEGPLRRRLLELGLTPGTMVTVKGCAPFGDPISLLVRGGELSLRLADARIIEVRRP